MRSASRRELSPLGRDLALSDIRLAAIRVLAGKQASESQLSAAAKLEQVIGDELSIVESAGVVPETAVAAADTRHEIETMLKGLSERGRHQHSLTENTGALRQLTDLLGPLSRGQLTVPDAESLLSVLHELSISPFSLPEPPDASRLR